MRATRDKYRGPGRRSRQEDFDTVRHMILVRADPWLLADSHWCEAPFVVELAQTMFRNRTASEALALRYVLVEVLRKISQDLDGTLTGRLAHLLAETDQRQVANAKQLGVSETWLSKEYMPRITSLVLDALNRMKAE